MTNDQLNIAELQNLAEAAGTEHPWHWHADPIKGDPLERSRYEITTLGRTITRTYYSDQTALHEAAFIAAANPQAILLLIERIKELEQVKEKGRLAAQLALQRIEELEKQNADRAKLLDEIIADLDVRARMYGEIENGKAVLDLSNGLVVRYYALKDALASSQQKNGGV